MAMYCTRSSDLQCCENVHYWEFRLRMNEHNIHGMMSVIVSLLKSIIESKNIWDHTLKPQAMLRSANEVVRPDQYGDIGHYLLSVYRSVLIRSLVVLDPMVGHTMDVLSLFISVLCHSDWLFHGEPCPRLDVVHPGRVWSFSPACTWHCSLHYLFLQSTPLFPHGVTTVC